MKTNPTAWRIFIIFFSVSALTIGGGYAMVPIFADRLTKLNWLDEAEFYDLFALGQSFPGPMALNTAVLVGQRLCGFAGAAAAFLGIILPPFVSILLVALLLETIIENRLVRGFLNGSYGVAIGLVAGLIYKLVRGRRWTIPAFILVLAGTAALIVVKGAALWIYAAIVLIAYQIAS